MKISSEAKDEDFSWQVGGIHGNSAPMNSDTNSTVYRKRFDWREDLANSRDLSKREIYAHAAEIGNGKGVRSPLDRVGIGSGMLGIA